MNVMPAASGGLEKLREPTELVAANADLAGSGSLFNFQAATGYRHLMAAVGDFVYYFALDAYTPNLIDSDGNNNGIMDFAVSNNICFTANGIRMMKWTGADWWDWGIAKPTEAATVTSGAGGGLTMTTGRKYRYAYGNSVTGHIGAASDASESTGALTSESGVVSIPNSADPQVDQIFLYGTMDGGAEYYWIPNPDNDVDGSYPPDPSGTTVITDDALDRVDVDDPAGSYYLDTGTTAPLYNHPPPVGKYLARYMGRIFVANLAGAPQGVVYSGDEKIFIGRPEESFPPRNRLRLQMGADEIRGIGAMQAGIIAFSKSNEMFMFRGAPEDNISGAEPMFSAFLEQLPYSEGCASHYSIVETAHGLVWLGSDKCIKIWTGSGEPRSLSGGIYPLLRTITEGAEENCRGFYWNWIEKEWYILAIPVGGSTLNRLVVVDLEFGADPATGEERNVGAFVLSVGDMDAIGVLEDANGARHIVFLQNGALMELNIKSTTVNGISQ